MIISNSIVKLVRAGLEFNVQGQVGRVSIMEKPDIQALKAATWLSPWEPFPDVQQRTEGDVTGYDLELVREVGPKHPLFAHKSCAIPIGIRCDCDDRLYWIPDEQHPFAVVHITWGGKAQQRSSDHPTTEFYASFDDWRERCMKKDHDFILQLDARRARQS